MLILVAIIGLIAGVWLSAVEHRDAAIIAFGATMAFGFSHALRRELIVRHTLDPFSPAVLFPCAYVLFLALGGITFALEGHHLAPQMYLCLAIGALGYSIGSALKPRRPRARPLPGNSGRMVTFVVISLALVSFAATLFMVYKVGLPFLYEDKLSGRTAARGEVSSYVIYLIRAGQFAAYISLFQLLTQKVRGPMAFVLWTVVVAIPFLNIIPGWRGPVFIMLLNYLIIIHYTKRRLKLSHAFASAIALAVLFLGWGFYRIYFSPEEHQTVRYIESLGYGGFEVFAYWCALQFSVYPLGILTILEIFPQAQGYLFGSNILITAATLLPGKQETLGELLQEWAPFTFIGGGLNPTIVGESYADLGYIGIFVLLFLAGAVISHARQRSERDPSGNWLIFYSYLLTSFVLSILTGFTSQASYLFNIAVFAFAMFLMRRRSMRP